MGGEDVGSDDEQYLNPDVGPPSDSESDEEQYEGRKSRNAKLQKKRSRAQAIEAITGAVVAADASDDEEGSNDGGALQSSSKRSKKVEDSSSGGAGPQSQRKLLLEAARGIAKEKTDVQAAFLWTCYTHALRMKGKEVNEDDKFEADQFYAPGTISKKNKSQKQSQSSKKNKGGEGDGPMSMATYLKGGALTSMKRLKKWKHTGSPMVLIVSISARRAVQVLKQLSPLNVRAAKLFAKHMDLDEQITMLRTNSFGIAVGTPNRLLKLAESGGNGGDGSGSDSDDSDDDSGSTGGALSLDGTELLVIDNHEDSKAFTVCTMNDTAPDLMQFLHKAVVPQMRKRKTLKIAMF